MLRPAPEPYRTHGDGPKSLGRHSAAVAHSGLRDVWAPATTATARAAGATLYRLADYHTSTARPPPKSPGAGMGRWGGPAVAEADPDPDRPSPPPPRAQTGSPRCAGAAANPSPAHAGSGPRPRRAPAGLAGPCPAGSAWDPTR